MQLWIKPTFTFFEIQGYSLILHHNKCVEMLHPSPSNSTRELTCSGLQRLKLAVFMNTPGTYRLFLIKDIKQGELPEPQSTCFRHFHYTFAAVFKEPSEDGDTSRAAYCTCKLINQESLSIVS